jgi:hypothetical protein
VDGPDTWHHVLNRGLAKRTLFESRRDIRLFLSRLALEVRAGRIEIHAYCVLTTHFHLLVRSPEGELSAVMQHVQNEYSRWFNRGRRRDGPLYRSRFVSKPVGTLSYRKLLVRYIDANPVSAGLVTRAEDYPHGSARHYAAERGPIWLERSWVEDCVRSAARGSCYRPEDYGLVFGPRDTGSLEVVERRIALPCHGEDPLDELLDGAVDRVRAWMRRKSELADGTAIGWPVCSVEDVGAVLESERAMRGAWELRSSRKSTDAWAQVHVALLRELCGITLAEAGLRCGRTSGHAWLMERRHRECILGDEDYATRVAELARSALRRCHRAADDAGDGAAR